jgi:ABC-type transport system substrate-binding protein
VSIIARECVKEDGTVTHPIGTGPFEFVEWKTNDYLKVKKFKDYWGKGLPFMDEVILKPVPDAMVRLTGLQAGDLDVVYPLPIEHVANLMKTPQKSYYFLTDSTAGVAFIHFNMSKPPFNDARVRQAVAYGINKQEMMMGIYQGHGEVVNQFVPKASRWHCDVPDMAQNKQKAKALLKEAGYPDGLEVTLTTSNAFPYMYKTAQIAQEQLKEIGMKINLDLSDWPATVKKMVSGDFAFGVAGWAPIVSDLDILYPTIFTPQGGYTFLMGKAYNNPKLVELIENAGTTLDFKKRKELYTRALETIIQDAPLVLICFGPGPFGARSYVKGFEAHANGFFVYGGGGLQYTWLDK